MSRLDTVNTTVDNLASFLVVGKAVSVGGEAKWR
jgi:hypothetical protein